jgi:hypothetical protein
MAADDGPFRGREWLMAETRDLRRHWQGVGQVRPVGL